MKCAINHTRRRNGNILITLLIFLTATIALGGLMGINVSERNKAEQGAKTAGNTDAYISIANVCADAFIDDLLTQRTTLVIADITNPTGDFSFDVYDKAIENIQTALCRRTAADGSWYHHLTDPMDTLDYSGIDTGKIRTYLASLLKDATVTIHIFQPMAVEFDKDNDNSATLLTGDNLTIEDIEYEVVLKKGAWLVKQEYKYSGAKIFARYDDTAITITVDGEDGVNQMTSQIISKKNTGN